ncbi:unnamed protein product [Euphydryas editha]|uniref:Uncharacterized protein n=1 Tax=Euphydryas editha TaxID=104508 RepID=A0AAU9URA8_EUPED|nr:unnamed protein product [Euphydryas editha]
MSASSSSTSRGCEQRTSTRDASGMATDGSTARTRQTFAATASGHTLSLNARIGWRGPRLPAGTVIGRNPTMSNITPLVTTVPSGGGEITSPARQ